MNNQELIERIESLKNIFGNKNEYVKIDFVIELISELDEPKKVVVPQFVADWIANVKRNGFKFRNSSRFHEEIVSSDDVYRVMYYILREGIAGEAIRIWVNANRDAFARAWLDGYEVEEEKRYKVVMKETKQPLYYNTGDKKLFFSMGKIASHFTRQQLEKLNFGWVFDCPGIEVLEVKNE